MIISAYVKITWGNVFECSYNSADSNMKSSVISDMVRVGRNYEGTSMETDLTIDEVLARQAEHIHFRIISV